CGRLGHRRPREPRRGVRAVHRARPEDRGALHHPLRGPAPATTGSVRQEGRGASLMSQVSDLLRRPWVRWLILLVVAVVLAVLPLMLPVFVNQTLTRIGVYAVAVLGLNIIMGYTGQIMLGQIFFLGVGAYVTAYGVVNDWNIVVIFIAA